MLTIVDFSIFGTYTFQIVALGSFLLGISSGISGTIAVLNKQGLLGDSIAHSSLAGIGIAFMVTNSKQTEVLLFGALVAGLLSVFLIHLVSNAKKTQVDSAMALMMAMFFGLGLICLSIIQKSANSNQAGLTRFLFGQAASILQADILVMLAVTCLLFVLTVLFWKQLKTYIFDKDFAYSLGFSLARLRLLVSFMIVTTVIIGIQLIGVVLMSSMMIAPAVAARQWTGSLARMMTLASLIGGFVGLGGTYISSSIDRIPTGPAIILIVSCVVIFSLVFAPKRGVFWRKQRKASKTFRKGVDTL
ncbi:metal ABC transporter permease [Granulicatella seriolae]|uniref:Metal ABC transporter permease n=1 Tax=Granulicatella seriolae TaxID=2967226 RepID=A0ABT1WLI4_9LACT|nr:metal ABC transporter permease [Granulicatella seriolae]